MKRSAWLLVVVLALLLSACGGPEARRDEFYQSALELFEQGKLPEAKVQVRNALKVDKKFAKGFLLGAKIDFEQKMWRGALGGFNAALDLDSELLEARIGAARVNLLVGNLDEAEKHADLALAIAPNDAEAGLVKAAVIARRGDRPTAMRMGEDVIKASPAHEETYAFLSLLAFQEGDLDGSINYLEQGLGVLPLSVALQKQLAGMYTRAERFSQAETLYQKLLRAAPDDFDLQRMLMRFYFESDQGEKARSMAESLVDKNPDSENYVLILAEVLSRLGDEEAQERILTDAIRTISPGYDLRLALAALYMRQGALDKAARITRETAEIDPANQKAVMARRALTDILVRQVKYDEAEAELEKIFEYSPNDMEAQVFMGRVALAKGDPLKAIGLFRQVLDEQPDLLPVYGHLSQAHYINGDIELAKEALDKALKVDPNFEQARSALINLYLADDEYDRAMNELREMARLQPENLAPVASMGDLLLMQGKYDDAAQRYRRLMKMDRGIALGLYKLGQMETRRGEYGKALDYFGQLLAGAPQAFQAAEAIVGVYLLQKQYDNALAFSEKMLENGPNPGAYDLMGRVEAARGNLQKAEAHFFKAKEIEPRWRDPYQMVGAMYLRAGKTEVAIEKFKQALKESPEVIGNAYVLGMLYQENGDNDAAAGMYEYALERDKNFLPAVNNLAYLYADSYTDADKLNRALELALRAAGRSSAATLDTLGWVYFKTGNNTMALSTLLRAMEMDNEDPVIMLHLATVHAAMGANDQARPLAEKVAAWEEEVPEKAEAAELLKTL